MDKNLKRAVDKAGGPTAFGLLHGMSQQRVSNWLARGKRLPAELVLKTEAALAIPRHELRPDLYPPPLEDAA